MYEHVREMSCFWRLMLFCVGDVNYTTPPPFKRLRNLPCTLTMHHVLQGAYGVDAAGDVFWCIFLPTFTCHAVESLNVYYSGIFDKC